MRLAAAVLLLTYAIAHAEAPNALGEAAATNYGADPTGVADSTSAINACLASVAPNGVCMARGKFQVLGNIAIPASTALWCGYSYPDLQDYNSGYQNESAIMLGGTISAVGGGATVRNCLIYRNGMTFPPPDSSEFSGIALSDNGNASFSIIDSEIIGFDSGAYFGGIRPYMNRVLVDAAGVNHAAVEVDTGNTDSGYIRDVRIYPLNGTGTCASLQRPGTGLRLGGSGGPGAYVDGVVVQGFKTYQFDFEGAGETIVGQIWADNPLGTCGLGNLPSIGVVVGPSASINANQVYIGSQAVGMVTKGNGAESTMTLLSIAYAGAGVVLGDAGHSGNLNPTNAVFQAISGAAIYIYHPNAGYHSARTVMANVNHGQAPYIESAGGFQTSVGLGPFGQFSVESLQTDLGAGAPFQSGAFVRAAGWSDTLSGINFQ